MSLYRIHLKTSVHEDLGATREELVNYCLQAEKPHLAIGWSYLHKERGAVLSLEQMIEAESSQKDGHPRTLSTFAKLDLDDIVWTRDTNGCYYLCRVTGKPVADYNERLDIGATVDVECWKVGTSVPGNVVSRFSHFGPNPTIQRIWDSQMISYTNSLYNQLSQTERYPVEHVEQDLCNLLPPLDLEEMVIDYLQIKYDYYLSKNSVAKMDTTIKIECELFPRKAEGCPAVVQVKNRGKVPPCEDYISFVQDGKTVYLFYANQNYQGHISGVECITKADIEQFAVDYRKQLPPSITKWIDLWLDQR